ncbi:MAG: type II toxin-antitoxin system PemK/MazF family toxin [Chitinophagales bacterium]
MEIKQYSVYWVNLDPVVGSEVSKTRPCVIISPDDMNKYMRTVIIAPLTHTLKQYPSRVACKINGENGMIMLDQIKTVDKTRLATYMGKLKKTESEEIKEVINEMLC